MSNTMTEVSDQHIAIDKAVGGTTEVHPVVIFVVAIQNPGCRLFSGAAMKPAVELS